MGMGVFGADAGATRYSPLNEIDAGKSRSGGGVALSARDQGTPPRPPDADQPHRVNGVLYTTIGNQRSVIALDAATGEPVWNWHPGDNERRWGDIIEPVARSAGRACPTGRTGPATTALRRDASFQLVALDPGRANACGLGPPAWWT